MRAHHNQEMFLSNSSNKKQLISLMKHYLEKDGQTVFVSDGDADTLIVEHALQIARQERNVNVVADDTDILVLLLHHWHREMGDIFFQSTRQKAEGPKVFNEYITYCGESWTYCVRKHSIYSCMGWMRHNVCDLWSW